MPVLHLNHVNFDNHGEGMDFIWQLWIMTSLLPSNLSFLPTPVALYAISAVYFAGVMVRLMLTLTPVVCMLSAVAFSSVFEHYLGDDMKRQSPPAEDSSDEDDKKNAGNLYDKVRGDQASRNYKKIEMAQYCMNI